MSVEKAFYGKTPQGHSVDKFILTNSCGMRAEVITFGATLDKLFVADKNGVFKDVLLGFDDLQGHMERSDYQGVVVGQYANRISGGEFTLNDTTYCLKKNENGITCLHGGGEFSSAVWDGEILSDNSVMLSYYSADGTNGFPGNVDVKVTYLLTDDNSLKISYYAVSDKDTVINLTNHAYFNLNDNATDEITNHFLTVNAKAFTPMDSKSIPTGEIEPVKDTPFDFTTAKPIGKNIDDDCEQLYFGKGYDHNFCLDRTNKFDVAAIAFEPSSGRELTVSTDMPGVQLYTGNFLKGVIGKGDKPMNFRTGFCLETQFFPDTPNHPNFPSCTFNAGQTFESTTVFSFSVR